MGCLRAFWRYRKFLIVVLTPLLLLPLPLAIKTPVAQCGYTLIVTAVYWISEAVPLGAAAMVPGFLFPLFGILKSSEVAAEYFKDFHLLLTGVICLAAAIEKANLHKRIALRMVMVVGSNPAWLMLGFMVTAAFLSMWLSNTSTAAMLMPIVEAMLVQIMNAEASIDNLEHGEAEGSCHVNAAVVDEELEFQETEMQDSLERIDVEYCTLDSNTDSKKAVNGEVCSTARSIVESIKVEGDAEAPAVPSRYHSQSQQMLCKSLSLCVAYASTIGGITTITGTSTNLIFAEQFNTRYPECDCINFTSWISFSLPISFIILILSWVWMHIIFLGFNFAHMFKCAKTEKELAAEAVIKKEYQQLGPFSYQELVAAIIFLLMAILWFTREPGFMPGWASVIGPKGYQGDATPALMLGFLLFIIPQTRPRCLFFCGSAGNVETGGEGLSDSSFKPMISWKDFQRCMPWEVSFLVGGGFALARGSQVSGLSEWIGSKLVSLNTMPVWLIILLSCLLVTTVTEVASNPATITLFLPILSSLAEAIHVNPLFILIPATISTSFAFLLPVSNPPNAIVFTYGHLKVTDMIKVGLGINIIGVLVVMLGIFTWGIPLFDLDTYPDWAPSTNITVP
ncbi:solute carrier family 13 member 1 [Petromyzon marinus]|uniref:Solute carrier family 13 member 1-like n=1 Tax=Petromyzon marinus TaxID=7757 RepID=A0AAJ7X0V5_PETMA|nr:solute carrier family 13 member 1-like [Petromyzon marinus]